MKQTEIHIETKTVKFRAFNEWFLGDFFEIAMPHRLRCFLSNLNAFILINFLLTLQGNNFDVEMCSYDLEFKRGLMQFLTISALINRTNVTE